MDRRPLEAHRPALRRHLGTILLGAAALGCAIVRFPPEYIERAYSGRIYPAIQRWLTLGSNMIPIALLDVAVAALLITLVRLFVVRARDAGVRRAIGRTVVALVRICAVLYLAFLALWGLNYRRVPLERKLDYDRTRITRDSVLRLANMAVDEINSGYASAHATPATAHQLDELSYDFWDAEAKLAPGLPTTLGVPKRSLLPLYFRRAGIDGMTDPFFLEIIVNPDVLDIERPMVVAHEWGDLAGYASESDASFIAWLACVRGDPLAQYSGWFAAYEHALRALPRQDRESVQPLASGPREDLRAMAARYARTSPVVRKAASAVYDEYLRANRVPEGIGSYDAVLRLMVGTRFDADWRPVVR